MEPLSEGVITMLGLWTSFLRDANSASERLGCGLRDLIKEGWEMKERRRLVKISTG